MTGVGEVKGGGDGKMGPRLGSVLLLWRGWWQKRALPGLSCRGAGTDDVMNAQSFTFESGVLKIRSMEGLLSLVGWPTPSGTLQPVRGKAADYRPGFRVIYPVGSEPDPALAEFRATLPDEVARILEPYESHQWNLLELLASRPEAMQLASNNPVLAYLLANNDHFRKNLTKPPAYLAQWRLDYKQQKLLEWLGFPATPAMVKLMRKIEPGAVTPESARLLNNALAANPATGELLAHVRRISRAVVELVMNTRLLPLLSPQLLAEAAELRGLARREEPASRLLDALADFVKTGNQPKLKQLVSLDSINQISDVLCRMYEEWFLDQLAISVVRPIPEDTADIIRLRTARDAKEEGAAQRNCVADRAALVARGENFIYRVLNPERATLEIHRRTRTSRWVVRELKGYNNVPVARPTIEYVQKWLAQAEATFTAEQREARIKELRLSMKK